MKSTGRAILAATVLVGGAMYGNSETPNGVEKDAYHYVITETTSFTSLDPLDADNTTNLPVARMIYATPLEISDENQLTSDVLEDFSYDPSTQLIQWTVKNDQKFDDNSPLTSADVAFAVARMAFTRPKFPVIEYIDGLGEWLKMGDALKSLPKGIKVEGRKIKIQLTKNVRHPLFRFCLELFSIIPKSLVNPTTNKITVEKIPSSGYYRIANRSSETVTFEKTVRGLGRKSVIPDRIYFEYITPDKVLTTALSPRTALAGSEMKFSDEDLVRLQKKFTIKFTPASRFSALLLNPNIKPFDKPSCRLHFANVFRATYQELASKSGRTSESSIFPKILPGYMTPEELAKANAGTAKGSSCQDSFSSSKIPWGYSAEERESPFVRALEKSFAKVGAQLAPATVAKNRSELQDFFVGGKVSAIAIGSGFWALDPAGDTKMLFTPNLHKALSFVSREDELQELLKDLDVTPDHFKSINQKIYDGAILSPYMHIRRFYASTNGNILSDVPFAITSPAPWQVFKKDN